MIIDLYSWAFLGEISLMEFVTLILPWKTEWMSKVEYELYNLDAKALRDEPHGRAGEIRHWWNFSVIVMKKIKLCLKNSFLHK